MSESRARNEAINIIKKASITKPNELTLEELILFLDGPEVVYEDINEYEGKFMSSGNSSIIKINNKIKTEGRKRFTLAHELGHYILHRNKGFINCTISDFLDWYGGKKIETEANYFASEILMPSEIFSRLTKGKRFSLVFLKELANDFNTSLTSTSIKFAQEGYDPILLICSSNQKIIWKQKNKDFNFFVDFKKLIEIPNTSVTYEKKIKGIVYNDSQEIDPVNWFIEDKYNEFKFYEDSIDLEYYGYTLTFISVR